MTDELTQAIDKLVEQKTFSLDAVGTIKDLRDKAAALERGMKSAADLAAQQAKDIRGLQGEVKDRSETITGWQDREKVLLQREAKVTESEKASAVAVAQSAVWSDAFHTIFRNTVVRETVNKRTPVSIAMQGGGSYVADHQTTEAITRETE